jgi:hypothetical protein
MAIESPSNGLDIYSGSVLNGASGKHKDILRENGDAAKRSISL